MPASPLLACILLAIDLAETLPDLADWWAGHQPALRHLSPAEREAAIAAKDRRKQQLTAPPPATPPMAIPPIRRVPPPSGQRRLV